MPFVKIDCGILDSTLWWDRDARDVFVTALLMAEPRVLAEPEAQLEVDSLVETGFVVPPGWYGFIRAAGVGIVRRALIEEKAGVEALRRLGSPDEGSRSPDFDGRRLVRVSGGYVVLNFQIYRDKDYRAAERMRLFRERKRAQEKKLRRGGVRYGSRSPRYGVTVTPVTQAEAEAEGDKRAGGVEGGGSLLPLTEKQTERAVNGAATAAAPGGPEIPRPEVLVVLWNGNRGPLPAVEKLTKSRTVHALARLREEPDPAVWIAAIQRVAASAFCRGEVGERGWRASFDWLLRPDTLTRIQEGKYDDLPPRASSALAETNGRYKLPSGWWASKDGFVIEKDFKTYERRGGGEWGSRYVREDEDGVAYYVTGAAIVSSGYDEKIRERERAILQGHPRFDSLFPEMKTGS